MKAVDFRGSTFLPSVFGLASFAYFLFALAMPTPVPAAQSEGSEPVLPPDWRIYGKWSSDPKDPAVYRFDGEGEAASLEIGGRRYRSRKAKAESGRLDLGELFGSSKAYDTAVVSALVESERPRRLRIGAGADWWMEWRVNGSVVYDTFPEGNGAVPVRRDEHVFDLPLRAGSNQISVRVVAGRAGFKLAFCGPEIAAKKPIFDFDEARVARLAERLRPNAGLGAKTVDDRAWWAPLAETAEGRRRIQAGREATGEAMPAYAEAAYDAYFEAGSREAFHGVDRERWNRLDTLVIAAVLSADRGLAEAAGDALVELAREPRWSPPWGYEQGRQGPPSGPIIELVSANKAAMLAEAVALLGPMLDPETVEIVRTQVRDRVAGPMADFIRNPERELLRSTFWWARARTNWNAVCTEGAVTAILATADDPRERARALLAARENGRRYLEGFSEDGYTSEGIGYWNYGFGHFLYLNELARRQTGGQMDLFEDPKAGAAARMPLRLIIADGVYPAFSDVKVGAVAHPLRVSVAGMRAGVGNASPLDAGNALAAVSGSRDFFAFLRPGIVASAGAGGRGIGNTAGAGGELPPRDFFARAEVLVARPKSGEGAKNAMGIALKVGHNSEMHNHNDVGSFVVAVGDEALLLDPGSPTYSSAVFDPKDRYTFRLLNSFGHGVPVVDGHPQEVRPNLATGNNEAEPRAKMPRILETSFGEETDTVRADLGPAYGGAPLRELERTWRYDRSGAGTLAVEDRFHLSESGSFETALVGMRFARLGPGCFCVVGEKAALSIEVDADFEWAHELVRIRNPGRLEPWRLGIRAKEDRRQGTVRIRIRPLGVDAARKAETLESRWLDARMSGLDAGG